MGRISAVGLLPRLCLLIPLACSPGTRPTQPTPTSDVRAIRALFQEYMDAIAAGDAERSMTVWAEDAIYYPPNSPPIYGWDAIAARARPYLARFDTRHEISSEGLEIHGELAVDRGTWIQTATPKSGGTPTVIRAKYVRVLRKHPDGSWKVWLDIWNPMPAPQ